jgi:hypothetical protein
MADDVIREVERDPREGVVVVVEEDADSVEVPPPCAACLGEATKRLPAIGVNWLELPYCDTCVPPRAGVDKRKATMRALVLLVAVVLALFVSWWFAILAVLALIDLGGPRGDAVKLLLSESGTMRLAFKNEEYARLFVEANGAELPKE